METNDADQRARPILPLDDLLPTWQALRLLKRELEAAGHPGLIDGHGRRWAWKADGLYRHTATEACAGRCEGGAGHGVFAWPRCLLPEPVTFAEAS
jgi:hypothetical protein